MSICNLFYPNKYQLFNTNANISGPAIDVYTFLSDSQKADVSSRAGVVDCSATVNALLVSQGIGTYYFRAGVWLFNSTFVIPGSSQAILGGGIGVTVFKFNNGGDTCVHLAGTLIDGLSNLTLGGFSINSTPAKTGGAGLIIDHVAYGYVNDIFIENAHSGISIYDCSKINIDNIECAGLRGATAFHYALKIAGDHTGPVSTIIINISNCTFWGGYTGMNGCLIENSVEIVTLSSCYFVSFRKGIYITTTGGTSTNFPRYIELLDCSIEGAQLNAAHVQAGHRIRFSNCFLSNLTGEFGQGSMDTNALQIDADSGWSEVYGIKVVNCSLGSSRLDAIQSAAKNILISGNDFKSSVPTAIACIKLVIGASDHIIIGNMANPTDVTVAPEAYYYGLFIDGVAISSILCMANNWVRCTEPYYSLSNSPNSFISNNVGYTTNLTSNGDPMNHPVGITVDPSNLYGLDANEFCGGIMSVSGGSGVPPQNLILKLPGVSGIMGVLKGLAVGKTVNIMILNTTNYTCLLDHSGDPNFFSLHSTEIQPKETRTLKLIITQMNPHQLTLYY